MPAPISTALSAMIVTMDAQAVSKKHTQDMDPPGSIFSQIKNQLPHEAQRISVAWQSFRSALDEALAKAVSKGI